MTGTNKILQQCITEPETLMLDKVTITNCFDLLFRPSSVYYLKFLQFQPYVTLMNHILLRFNYNNKSKQEIMHIHTFLIEVEIFVCLNTTICK